MVYKQYRIVSTTVNDQVLINKSLTPMNFYIWENLIADKFGIQ